MAGPERSKKDREWIFNFKHSTSGLSEHPEVEYLKIEVSGYFLHFWFH